MGFAVPWLTLLLGGSPTLVALIVAAEEASMVLLLIPAGIWADRVARRRLLQVAAIIQSLVALSLLWLVFNHTLSIPLLILAAVILTIASCIEYAAGFGSVRQLVPDSELPAAQSSLVILKQVGAFGGPALGGLLFTLGGQTGLMVSLSIVCLVGLVAAGTIRSTLATLNDEPLPTLRTQITKSIHTVTERGIMRALLVTGGTWNLAVAMSFPVLLVLLRLRGFTASDVAIVLAAGIIGSFGATPMVRYLVTQMGALKAVVYAGSGEAAFIAIMAVAGGPLTTALCYGALMICNTTVASALTGERARLAPLNAQSATSTTGLAVHLSGYLVGTLLCSLLVGLLYLPDVWLLSGVCTFGVMLVLSVWSRHLSMTAIKEPIEETVL